MTQEPFEQQLDPELEAALDGDDERIRVWIHHSEGPVKGPVANTLRINQQSEDAYSGISKEYLVGTLGQSAPSAFAESRRQHWINREITNSGGALTIPTPHDDYDDIGILIHYRSRFVDDGGG